MAEILIDAIAKAEGHLKAAEFQLLEAQKELKTLKAVAEKINTNTIKAATNDIKTSIEKLQDMKKNFNQMTSGNINQIDASNVMAAIELVKSIEQNLMKSETVNEEDKKTVQSAIKTATGAAEEIEKIINEYVKNEMITSIKKFEDMKMNLKELSTGEIDQTDVENIKAAIKMVQSFEESLMKSAAVSEDDKRTVQSAIMTATGAAEAIEKIVNEWLVVNNQYVKNEIKASIQKFEDMKKNLKDLSSREINQIDAENIKAAIETIQSIEEDLMKSEKLNEEEKNTVQSAIKTASGAAYAIDKIINDRLDQQALVMVN